jgi:hypothetical protein
MALQRIHANQPDFDRQAHSAFRRARSGSLAHFPFSPAMSDTTARRNQSDRA